ncbi:MAG: PQQ-binding-like beta-propeller repeat protein [Verrucomicrobiota bacterium]
MKTLIFLSLSAFCVFEASANWPSFRGDGTSRSNVDDLPLTWSDTENLAWAVDLPGYGQSSPVIWDDRVFVTSTEGAKKEQGVVLCYALEDGKLLWSKAIDSAVQIEASNMVSRGAPTAAVDADAVYAFFESGDVVAYSHDGEQIWKRDLIADYGKFGGMHGIGSSLAQNDEAVFVLAEHDGPSYLLALDKKDGKNLWKIDREKRVSWSSPIVSEDRIYISSNGVVESRNAADGAEIWKQDGVEGNNVPSPSLSADGELIAIGSSAPQMSRIVNADSGETVWSPRVTSSFGSPLVAEGLAYFVNRAGALQCVDLESGELRWETRLSESTWATPLAAAGRIYCFCKNGTTVVLEAGGAEPKVIAENTLTALQNDKVYGYAISEGSIVARAGSKLICIR